MVLALILRTISVHVTESQLAGDLTDTYGRFRHPTHMTAWFPSIYYYLIRQHDNNN